MQPGDAQQITQKKKMSGCLVALIVCGVVGGLMCICTGVGLAVFATSEDGQKFAEAVSRSQAEMENAGKRPGVKELVAAGCPAASVMDTSDHRIFAELFLDAGPAEKADDYLWVQCWGARGYRGTLPTCEALAAVYAKAAPSPRDFVILVSRKGDEPECRKKFSGDGEFIEDVER